VTNLVRNYSPHLRPNTREAPSTAELRKILGAAAREMLEDLLAQWRRRRAMENELERSRWEVTYSVSP
jgi:vacuolar protein sorting-associated protein 3